MSRPIRRNWQGSDRRPVGRRSRLPSNTGSGCEAILALGKHQDTDEDLDAATIALQGRAKDGPTPEASPRPRNRKCHGPEK